MTGQVALCDAKWESFLVTKTKGCWTSRDEFLSVFHSIWDRKEINELRKGKKFKTFGLISELTISSTGTSVKEDKDKSRQFSSNLSFSEFIFDGIVSTNLNLNLVLYDEFPQDYFQSAVMIFAVGC